MTGAEDQIRDYALGLGFDGVHFTEAALPGVVLDRMRAFVERGEHGSMAWLEDRLEKRAQPRDLWPDARSAIVLTMNYGPDHDPMEKLARRSTGNISVYAQNEDYHDVVKKRLKAVGRWMAETFGCELKVFVDTAPVAEKPLAEQAGGGWQGKHTNLVSRTFGSWLFLGVIYTTLDLSPDRPEQDHCGSCRKCLDACPTDAFPAPYRIDARRCISYLTIEHKGPIPTEFRAAMGNRIYGCDDCLAVCPWNKFAERAREARLKAREELENPDLAMLAALDDEAFRKLFRKSPVKRIGRDRFVRNVAIAIGNSGERALGEALTPLLTDASEVVRDAAEWAKGRLEEGPDPLGEEAGPDIEPG